MKTNKAIVSGVLALLSFIMVGFCFPSQNKPIDKKFKGPFNGVFLGLLGDGSLISANYEHFFGLSNRMFLSAKAGIGYNEEWQFCIWGGCGPPEKYFTIPHSLTLNYGRRNFLEFGFGGTKLNGQNDQHYMLYPILAYRLHPRKSDTFYMRFSLSYPFNSFEMTEIIYYPLGIGLGGRF